MKTSEHVEATDTPAIPGGVRMAIERLKRVLLPFLSGKDLQTATLESNDRAVHSANRAIAFRVWIMSLLIILVAVYWFWQIVWAYVASWSRDWNLQVLLRKLELHLLKELVKFTLTRSSIRRSVKKFNGR